MNIKTTGKGKPCVKRAEGGPIQPRVIALLESEDRLFSNTEIAEIIGVKVTAINSAARNLAQQGLLRVEKVGRHPMYGRKATSDFTPILAGARVIRLEHRNMQPPDQPLRKQHYGVCGCSLTKVV